MRWLLRLIGGALFTAIMVPTTTYCILTHFPHTPTCPCARCVRKRARAEREMESLRKQWGTYPPQGPLMTTEEWEEWKLEHEPLPWEKDYKKTR